MNITPVSAPTPLPPTGTPELQFINLLEQAVLAPSGHNTQPWLFHLEEDHLDIIADRTRALPVVDPLDRELTISCGAALDHLVIAARYHGRDLVIKTCPETEDSDLLARVWLGSERPPTASDHAAFSAIQNRRTTRSKFDNRTLPESLSTQCLRIAEQFGVELLLITDRRKRSEIADLVAEGDRRQFADPHFRRELGGWVHSRRRASRDGMSGNGFGMPDVLSPIGGLVIRTFDLGTGVAAADVDKIVEGSPTLALFACRENTVPDWLATGRALSGVLLALTAAGATASYLNPPVEVADLTPRLKALFGSQGAPQLLMRFGYGPMAKPAVRREVRDVLV